MGKGCYWEKKERFPSDVLVCWCCSVTHSCPTLCDPMNCIMPGSFIIYWSLLKFMPTESVIPSNHLILCFPLLLLALIFLSIRVVSKWVSSLNQMAKASELNFIISPSNEYSGLISFRMDWFDLLPVQGTLNSLLHHHNLKASILQHSKKLKFLLSSSRIHTWLLEKS